MGFDLTNRDELLRWFAPLTQAAVGTAGPAWRVGSRERERLPYGDHETTKLREHDRAVPHRARPLGNRPGQAVERIDPPSWWVESQDQALTLLLEGSGLAGAKVKVARGPIRVGRVEPGREGRALFVELTVPGGADVGRCEIEIAVAGRTIRRGWDLVAKPTRRPEPFGPDDVIYLIMVDRFANGDPANDEPPGGDRLLDRRDTHAYHGGDFAGIRRKLPYLADLGVTAIWLTPVYRPRIDLVRGEPRGHTTEDG